MSPPGLSQKSTLYRLGGFAAGNPWRVLAGWAVVIALVVGLWAAFGEGTSDDITIPGMPSQQALDLLEERFPEQAGGRAVAVFATSDGTMSDPPNAEAVRATLDRIGRLDGVAQVIEPFGPAASLLQSPDGTVAYAQILYDRGAREVTPEQIDDLFATGDPAREAGLEVGFGGQVVERTEPEQARTAELVGLAVAVAEMAFAGGMGASISLAKVPRNAGDVADLSLLFSESNSRFVCEVPAGKQAEFEQLMSGVPHAALGEVNESKRVSITGQTGDSLIDGSIAELKEAWQSPLRW